MPTDPRTPVLVGAGVVQQRLEDPAKALEPIELMIAALERAAADAGSPDLLAKAESIRAPRGFWDYPDPGRLIADRFGASHARTLVAEVGVLQTTLFGDACRAIAAGELDVALVTGGEAKYRSLRAQISGGDAPLTQQRGVEPDVVLRPKGPILSPLEMERGLVMPVTQFAIIENALRDAQGLGIDAHRREISDMWAGFSRVAAANPHAWERDVVGAAEIAEPSGRNRMLAFPYTKLHNSQWNVDQAAGLILCSVGAARAAGVRQDRWVFPWAATESNHMQALSERAELHRSPGFRIAGRRALEPAGLSADQVQHLDLYSCFPAAVRIQVRELGIALDRPLTVTGGMAFAGGPLNNYVLQAMARMAEVLREDPGSTGLVTAVSGIVTKQGVTLWSTEPPAGGFRFEDVSDEVARELESAPMQADREGPARIASYTVVFDKSGFAEGIALCDFEDGARTIASTRDAELASAMTEEEFCGRAVEIGAGGMLIVT